MFATQSQYSMVFYFTFTASIDDNDCAFAETTTPPRPFCQTDRSGGRDRVKIASEKKKHKIKFEQTENGQY